MATAPFTCFAIAAPGLEPIVATELARLGERPRVEDGGVSWEGDARSMMRANLWLRTASRVLVRVARFRAAEFYELERRAKKIEWERFIAPGVLPDFRVTAHKSRLYHSDAIAQRLTLATATRKAHPMARPAEKASQLFVVRVVRDNFEISADTSGELLHMRGYRTEVAKAPLRETLAAALLLASEWDGHTPLLDPFCGSGTIPIEGALIARRIAPGAQRRFSFMLWPDFYEPAWRRLLDDAHSGQRRPGSALLGSDRDAGAVEASIANAERAGVAGDIAFSRQVVSAIEAPGPAGLIATNPPYGVRVSGGDDVRNLYAQLGKVLRARFSGWRVSAYVPNAALARQARLPFTTLYKTSNGGINVSALGAEIPVASKAD